MTWAGELLPIAGQPVLTAAEMRAAEQAADADATTLMRRAGEGVAEVVRRLSAGADVLVLCGPGNNGGDGWVAAAALANAGVAVRVAAHAEPATDLARAARAKWSGPVEPLTSDLESPVVVDALFGTGLSRPLPDDVHAALSAIVGRARLSVAVDLPSGIATDDGAALSPVRMVDLTLALGAVKPAHLLQPGAGFCGAVRVVPIGVSASSATRVLARPDLPPPGPGANKFTRGMVAVVPGAMTGAALLASEAAARAGAGYPVLLDGGSGTPHALVRKPWSPEALGDKRIDAVLIGNGLGRDDVAKAKVAAVLASDHALVIDGDALHLVTPEQVAKHGKHVILTPHEGEFKALFGELGGSKIDRARAAAKRADATVVYKGADTVIASPDGTVTLAGEASHWLSTAGSGDVLAGTTAAMLAGGLDPHEAAAAAVWLNGDAARRCGGAFIADDLARALTAARAGL